MVNSQNIAILSEKVAALEAAIKNAGIELPEVDSSDNGKTLQVVEGAWATGSKIPEVVNALDSESTTDALSAAQGKVLNDSIEAIGGTVYKLEVTGATDATGLYNTNLSTDEYMYIGTTIAKSIIVNSINAISDGKIRLRFNNTDGSVFGSETISGDYYFWKLPTVTS